MSDSGDQQWLSVTRAAAATGYSRDRVQELARESQQAGQLVDALTYQGKILVRLTPRGYEIYMPSLKEYIEHSGRGPYKADDDDELEGNA